jgi:fatty acid desaturase
MILRLLRSKERYPMEGFVGRRGLIEAKRLRSLSQRSDLRGALQLGSHAAALVATGIALKLSWGTLWAVPAFMLHGTLLSFLYAGQHEMSHATVFRTRGLNEAFGRAIGFLMLYPRDFDQLQHFAHHRYTQDWARDGELERPRYTLRSFLLWVSGPTYWYSRIRRIFRFAAGIVTEGYIREAERPGLIREARRHLAGYAVIAGVSVATGSWAAVTYWLAPLLLMKWTHQLQNVIEHFGLTHADDTWINTRSTRTNTLMRWVCWNMQYHTAHHTYPAVPFHALPELHRELVARTGTEPPSMSYLGFMRASVRALSGGRREADYPEDVTWVAESSPAGSAAPAAHA